MGCSGPRPIEDVATPDDVSFRNGIKRVTADTSDSRRPGRAGKPAFTVRRGSA